MELKIEKGVPLQALGRGGGRKGKGYTAAIRTMDVGDSFTVPTGAHRNIHALFGQNGRKCATRKQPDGTHRVWRVA